MDSLDRLVILMKLRDVAWRVYEKTPAHSWRKSLTWRVWGRLQIACDQIMDGVVVTIIKPAEVE